jgi:4-hydroxybenzoate polyprenyltransferase
MVWNDYFDRAEDAQARPFRPIPSGRVTVRTTVRLGVVLLILGLCFAALVGLTEADTWNPNPLVLAGGLTGTVLLYDGWLKRTPVGPMAMAACRFLNVLLGLTALPDETVPLPLRVNLAWVVGVYIVGVTWFARTEEGSSRRRHLLGASAVIAAALVLALLLRARLPAETGTVLFPYLLVGFGFLVGVPVARAVRRPGPREVQAAVKRCVLGLVALDAVLATAFVGVPGLLVLLLLPPALVIGKWVYST